MRLLVHVEGQTEEAFVNEIIRDHLCSQGYSDVSARLVGNSRLRHRRGGIRAWPAVRRDIVAHLRQDPACVATTLVDFYALPRTGEKAWPGRNVAARLCSREKALAVEGALAQDVSAVLGKKFNRARFVPFVIMHEFEALLFSDCNAFSRSIYRPDLAGSFQRVRDLFSNPEDINDSPLTAPSKRVEAIVPGYDKPLLGTLAVLEIGLTAIRQQCPHFAEWLSTLESLPQKL